MARTSSWGILSARKPQKITAFKGKIPGKKARVGQRLHFLIQYNANARTIIDRARQRKDLGVLCSSLNAM